MHKQGVAKFSYYFVGINSLAEMATREDRVCVLNILGNESRSVTPTSHAFSGGNVVFGTSPGRSGEALKTPVGDVPVYNNVAEGMAAGHRFNTAVIYMPPAAVKDAVAEAVRVNRDLGRIIIVTEKVPVRDARVIRAIGQLHGIDVLGANCLGVGDAWNQVRIGGALGGSNPAESLVKGSVAIFSNSGNFTTTIAVYLLTQGWGTTTSVSSGKDVYIHFAAPEFFNALANDDRSKAAVLYVEPGGYYEANLEITKPTVACVVGRWKARLTKAVGHAGAIAGGGDDAAAKERWLMRYFGVDGIYTPENPVFSAKGAVVTNISHIPEALTRVMEANGIRPDFEPRGNLSLKCWFANNQGLRLPSELDVSEVEAVSPYNEQIHILTRQVGASYPRQRMKDASGASLMDPKTQLTRVHGVSILDASKHPLESNLVSALLKEYPDDRGSAMANIAFNAFVHLPGDPMVAAAEASRQAGNSPNTVLSAAVSILGRDRVSRSCVGLRALMKAFAHRGLDDPWGSFDHAAVLQETGADALRAVLVEGPDPLAEEMLAAARGLDRSSVFLRFSEDAARQQKKFLSADGVLAAIWATLGWRSLIRKRNTRHTFLNLPWYSRAFSSMVACSVPVASHEGSTFCGVKRSELVADWSFTETAYLSLVGRRPSEKELFEFSLLLGLIISNGPGTISAQGSKGAVSADGPENPGRVQINKAFVGFLTHTGFAHGGNGYEAIAFLLEQFRDKSLGDPGDKKHGLDLKAMARSYADWYLAYKAREKAAGNIEYRKIPCVNHPVFKGKDVNVDPREEYVRNLFQEQGIYNVFLDLYHHLVWALFKAGVSKNVYCVNVDAVIAVILLKLLWGLYTSGKLTEKDLESGAFTTFLYGRMIGCAAEIDDHLNRGRNMDTRTPASKCRFVG